MKILAFGAYYTPEIAASMYLTEDTFAAFAEKNQVKLYVPTPTRGVSEKIRHDYKKKKIEHKYNGNLEIRRIPLFAENKNSLMRFIRYIFMEIEFFFIGLFSKADMIFAQSTPPIQGLTCAVLKKIKKVPFIYNLQDIFPDSLVNTGMSSSESFAWKLGRKIEDFTYQNSDQIVVISENFKQNIMNKGVPENKITIIENWVDSEAVVPVSRNENPLFDKYCLDKNKFYVTYCGNVGFTQNMDMLLDTAKELQKQYTDIKFVIVGDGAYKEQVEKRAQAENILNVTLLPFQSYEDISYVFSLGDVGLIISKSGIGMNSVPSKTWSIMSAERPVLASFDKGSMLDDVISKTQCGVCVEAENQQALVDEIIKLYNMKNDLPNIGKKGRQYILENLTSKIGKEKWKQVL